GDATAACAAVLALLCAPMVFYEGMLLRDTLVALAGLAIVSLAGGVLANASRDDRPPLARAMALGLCGGLAWLLKITLLATWLAVAAGVAFAYRRRRRRLAGVAAAT